MRNRLLCFATVVALSITICTGYMVPQSEYQSDQSQVVYKMPRRHSAQFKVFAECRRDCAGKCNHSLYAYLANKNECFTCLLECMSVFTEQAEKMGIRVEMDKGKKRARRVTPEFNTSEAQKVRSAQQTRKAPYNIRNFIRSK